MCGIFGGLIDKDVNIQPKELNRLIKSLYKYSESRGKESSGIATNHQNQLQVIKAALPASEFQALSTYQKFLKQNIIDRLTHRTSNEPISYIAHTRLVTNGSSDQEANNQPVQKYGYTIVHNGIICNVKELWDAIPQSQKQADVDTEILLEMIHKSKESDLPNKLKDAFRKIEGAASIALLDAGSSSLTLATNTGSLYYTFSHTDKSILFASEAFILTSAIQDAKVENIFNHKNLKQLHPGQILVCSPKGKIDIHEFSVAATSIIMSTHKSYTKPTLSSIVEYPLTELKALKRCSHCILPSTFPYIYFDENGVCNYCHNYKSQVKQNKPEKLYQAVIERRKQGQYFDCIVPFSGGRDSSYGIHYLVKEMGLKPLTFTYDWGMVTDLARRNIARICGNLGLENILVSANINQKRKYIRKNVSAWLKRPSLGIIPLFMAGDKQFFKYVNQIKRQTNIEVDIWMGNGLENTDFKTGFCGVPPAHSKERIDALPGSSKLKLLSYYGKEYLLNPRYLNSSIPDTFNAYLSYYFEPRINYHLLFDYIPWEEQNISETIINKYNWETSSDTRSTWRIGDGTAPFYNYIYTTIAGFSEIDTFRSNQIREGQLERNKALELTFEENAPREESLRWYLEAIQLPFNETIQTINKINRLYRE